ncbi:transcriptional regulator with XRE-family HTH domain [Desulfosalsimonas propionicica]|uniref:Transcriptional regulator with XRE-family HTH domain n=1 Tax=Desulfosalsimonas propionicica TaxID=332175 RepID=A0A7W0CC64_9BACT|nr:helix-turn-helix transcriptional regulator [Desulfosalsimonas propionicica]MBA2882972.1 transcriptional regulator with XRE-family HTH domain [Desulfosalsimonas propionicica]
MKKGLQTIIAKRAKISLPFLSLILSGQKRPSWRVSKRLEKVTGISAVDWIDARVNRDYLEKNYCPDNSNRRKHEHRNAHDNKTTNSSNETIQEENVTDCQQNQEILKAQNNFTG